MTGPAMTAALALCDAAGHATRLQQEDFRAAGLDVPRQNLIYRLALYAAISRAPELRHLRSEHRAKARAAVRAYRRLASFPGGYSCIVYDDWKTTDPRDRMPEDEREKGCTCSGELGAGGMLKHDRDCPVHGIDPDAEYERRRDEREGLR